eukprot:765321-Prymnesium_polylepis.1
MQPRAVRCEAKIAWRPSVSRAIFNSPLVRAAHPLRLPQPGGAAEPVAGGTPVSIVQNISGDLLDGGAEPYHDADDAGDRVGSLDDDEQRA